MKLEILIATNGFKGTWSSIEYGAWLAGVLETNLTLLGITENLNPAELDDHHPLEDLFAEAVEIFQSRGIKYNLEIQNGTVEEILPQKTRQGSYLTVVSPLGRPHLRRLLTGRSIRRLIEQIDDPILYVPEVRLPLKKALICIGGLGYEVTAEHIAMQMAMKSKAEITLLHIIPPMDLDYPTARAVRDSWQNLTQSDTPVGKSLRSTLEIAQADGLTAQVKTRRGNIVEEILSEIKEGNYDLLSMGSAYGGASLRQLYAPNITAEIAVSAQIPTLSAKYKRQE
ncbi:MAG: universal stress protein [Anaerolineales bacterium]|nr:universal stress protein [Anaerolineales bacterium]MCZ2123139.1 universal stress protein [Anaerolineales bacterium]